MNPKSMDENELFGSFDNSQYEFKEGIFTKHFRDFARMTNDKTKWLLLDGPIDLNWVENLNSILDDNKKMSLPNGEQIKMTDSMNILLETDHIRNITPATVSRCGLVQIHREEACQSKAIFNQWMRTLPPNLSEFQHEIETNANYLMVEAIAIFKEEEEAGLLSLHAIDLYWLTQNLVRLLTAIMYDYFLEYEKSTEASLAKQQSKMPLGGSLYNLS